MNLFSSEYWWLWASALALALFFPVRNLIYVLMVRRANAKGGARENHERARLKRRATVTSILLCFLFSFFYTLHLFGDPK